MEILKIWLIEKHTLYLMSQEDPAQTMYDIMEAHMNNEDKCKSYRDYIGEMQHVMKRLLDESEPSDPEIQ